MTENGSIKSTVVIPNYNGIAYIENCLDSLLADEHACRILVIDNHSTDGSLEILRDRFLEDKYPMLQVIECNENTGFCKAVNLGIEESKTEYVILLNNDTTVEKGFVKALEDSMDRHTDAFSVGAKMVDMKNPALLDDGGDFYCALGWAFAGGKGKPAEKYNRERKVFSACAGAAIYRKSVLDEIGLFDENHFAYLEDLDIGYRAKIYGYNNYFTPDALVYHAGSAASGSRHNAFKVDLSSKNNMYVIYKNMPLLQWLFNLPLLVLGCVVKWLFFIRKGLGGNYRKGVFAGIKRNFTKEARKHKVKFEFKHLPAYLKIQWELWKNLFMMICY